MSLGSSVIPNNFILLKRRRDKSCPLVCSIGQIRNLTGLTADPLFIQLITHEVYNFRPDVITKIDTVRAVHLGTKFIVEVHIVLMGSMALAMAHDIGEELQRLLEKRDDVEQAFVHLDFESNHLPAIEHKVI
jgi:divalent metal cation (Fe/Co/Zn/Cd) transporter